MNIYRQGDVLIIQVNDDIKVGDEIERDNNRVILALGEVTGHAHHILDKNVQLFQPLDPKELALGTKILKILDAMAMLQHDEHGPIVLPKGTYMTRIQREYTPQGLRNVAD